MDGIANHFPAKKCRIAESCIYNLNIFFAGSDTPSPTETPLVLGPKHRFPLCSSAFPFVLFYETTTGRKSIREIGHLSSALRIVARGERVWDEEAVENRLIHRSFSLPFLFRFRNDLYCVEWGVKLYSLTPSFLPFPFSSLHNPSPLSFPVPQQLSFSFSFIPLLSPNSAGRSAE